MTQDEYNNLTDEEKNALFATEILGWKLDEDNEWTSYEEHFDNWLKIVDKKLEIFDAHTFDPINNLDYAFMGVDKLMAENWQTHLQNFELAWNGYQWFCAVDSKQMDNNFITHPTSPNEAIMEAALRAKGVVE